MTFVHPALLAGLVAAALPVLLHLLGRRRGRLVEFAAVEFLLASERRLAARRRLHDLVLLLARAALIAAAALAVARPLPEGAEAAGSGPPVSLVAVVDATASMGAAGRDGRPIAARARAELERRIDALPAGSEVAVLGFDRRVRPATAGFVAPAEARRAVAAIAPGPAGGSAGPALAAAVRLLAGARREARRIAVASDLDRAAWDDERLAGIVPAGVALEVIDAAPEGFAFNLGLTAAEPVAGRPDELAIAVRASGEGGLARREAVVEVRAGERVLNRGLAVLEAGAIAELTLALPPDAPGGGDLVVALREGGSLAADDRRWPWRERGGRVRVLLADGDPDPDLYRDEVFYLDRAFASEPDRFAVRLVDASQGRLGPLEDIDVAILANVERLEGDDARAMLARVEQGMGLVAAPGDRSGPEALGRLLGRLAPARPRSILAARAGEVPFSLAPPGSPPHVVVAPFDDARALESLTQARFERILALEPETGAEVVLRFHNGLPALVLAGRGAGRVALYASSADRDWNNLAVRPAYLPLVTRTAAWAAGRLAPERPRRFRPGDRVPVEPVAGQAPEYEAPDGHRVVPEQEAPGRFAIAEVGEPGPWRASAGGRAVPEADFVVNFDPAEGQLVRLEPDRLEALLGRAAVGGGRAARPGSEARAALPLSLLLGALFAAEAGLAARAARRAGPEPGEP